MTLTFETRNEYDSTAQGLKDLCNTVYDILGDNLQIIEIGSYCGSSATIISNKFVNSTINCVDMWEKYVEDCSTYDLDRQELELKEAESIFDKVTSSKKNIVKNKTSSLEFCKTIPDKSIDFIYIDGNHQYSSVKEDLIAWIPKIKNGGIVSGHDHGWISVSRALSEVFQKNPDHIFCDSSWVYKI
jgi:predicted O-methyltransferase YrrM